MALQQERSSSSNIGKSFSPMSRMSPFTRSTVNINKSFRCGKSARSIRLPSIIWVPTRVSPIEIDSRVSLRTLKQLMFPCTGVPSQYNSLRTGQLAR
eukprot:scaffold41681_cov299-Skeletonema_marinoi.AAC.1